MFFQYYIGGLGCGGPRADTGLVRWCTWPSKDLYALEVRHKNFDLNCFLCKSCQEFETTLEAVRTWWASAERAAWSGWPCWAVTSSMAWAELPGHGVDHSYVSGQVVEIH